MEMVSGDDDGDGLGDAHDMMFPGGAHDMMFNGDGYDV